MKLLWLCGLIGCLLASHAATARPGPAPRRSVSSSTWLLEADLVTVRLELPAGEAASLVGRTMPLLSTENLAKYVLGHVSVTAGGSPCEPTDQGYDIGLINSLSLGSKVYGFEIIFRCSQRGALSLHNALMFAEAPQHVDFARIERGGVHATQLFTDSRRDLSIPDGGELPSAGFGRFLLLGASHLWHSVERLCAIFSFCALARTRRQLAVVVAALAVGYAASLLLFDGGLIPNAEWLNSGLGFVVACVAAVMVRRSLTRQHVVGTPIKLKAVALTSAACALIIAAAGLHRPGFALALGGFALIGAALTSGGASLPIAILPALAGLLDGLVLPADYGRLRQWSELASGNLAAFDAGALLSEALLLGAFSALAALIVRRTVKGRSAAELFAPLAGDIATTLFAGVGSFWLLSGLS